MIWQDTCEKYIGQWHDNFQNGMGIHIWYESKGEQKYLRNRYVGEWKNGFRHGYGVFFYANGGKYEGMWEQNYKNGYGIFTFHDGSQFSGKFTMDRMDYNNIGYLPAENIHKMNSSQNTILPNKTPAHNKLSSKGKELKVIKDEEEEETSAIKKNNIKEQKDRIEDKEINEAKKKTSMLATSEHKYNNSEQLQVQSLVKNNEGKDKMTGMKKTNISQDLNQNAADNKKITDKKTGDKVNIESQDNKSTNIGKKNEVPKDEKKSEKKMDELSEENQNKGLNKKQSEVIKLEQKENTSKFYSKKTTDQIDPSSNKNNNANISNNPDNQKLHEHDKKSESKTVFTHKTVKESEQNPFRTLLDIADIIETEPEMENCLKDVENTLLRYLSEIKLWYRIYTNKDVNNLEDTSHQKDNNNQKSNHATTEIKDETILDNNDIGFAMELKDLWKFIRDSNILSIDFSLANFNRIYFRGPKNYIEMFLCPDEIKLYSKEYFDYVSNMIQKSKEDFMFRNRDKFINSPNLSSIQSQDLSNLLFKPSEIESNIDIHYKKNIILLRQFFESIVRIAYLKYFQSKEPLHKKIKMLIDECIKTNPNLKRNAKKSNTHDSSLNSTLILDMKAKIFEYSFDLFIKENDQKLKKIFHNLFVKATNSYKKTDITITYRFFFDNLIMKSSMFQNLFDKFKFTELMTIYHKEKININEENKLSKEVTFYIESLFDCEIIYYEFCELVFFTCRKYVTENNIIEKKEKDTFNKILDHFIQVSNKADSIYNLTDRYIYHYPKLPNHKKYEALIEADKQRKMIEEKKRMELKRLEMERNLISLEDINILPSNEIDEVEDEMSDNSLNEGY